MVKAEDEAAVNPSSISEFGDDNFVVGRWEEEELMSQERHMNLMPIYRLRVHQLKEQARHGESTCTAFVIVIADWLPANPNSMPTKSQFDNLTREDSREWRNFCQMRPTENTSLTIYM
ncbi:hypothetical protein AMTR_s00269p00001410 [Amborella trichopoda]|uniref:Uncharacterized protein n=1 Tax=Amborella trichopoda TaxID=13333 RepID=W1PA07_AMBTC|nr:hypothetical protein AMTR_s00269p00001410 [Amborella trichopoda]